MINKYILLFFVAITVAVVELGVLGFWILEDINQSPKEEIATENQQENKSNLTKGNNIEQDNEDRNDQDIADNEEQFPQDNNGTELDQVINGEGDYTPEENEITPELEPEPECVSGDCCNINLQEYYSNNRICDSEIDVEYGCPWGMQEGSNVGIRYQNRYCSGYSNLCNGNLKWNNWEVYEYCSDGEFCQDGECIKLTCSDGTEYGACSNSSLQYCDEGNLVDNPSVCGCPSGEEYQTSKGCVPLSCDSENGTICEGYQVCDGNVLSVSDSNMCCDGICRIPMSFDWRDRHGENWNSPIKNQGSLASCTSFGGVASIEAAINLYYNQHLNIDLSEMATISCSDDLYHSNDLTWDCSNINAPAVFICNAKFAGMLEEECYPYVDHLTQDTFICNNLCDGYENDLWHVSDFVQMLPDDYYCNFILDEDNNVVYSGPLMDRLKQEHISEEALKESIIKYGPVALNYSPWGHAISIVGWDYDMEEGQFWIIKNSWGISWEDEGYGKIYDSDMNNFVIGIVKTPITPPQGTNYQISCVDKDKDGYCNWGVSEEMPSYCPPDCKNEKDWDDSNPNIGPLGEY